MVIHAATYNIYDCHIIKSSCKLKAYNKQGRFFCGTIHGSVASICIFKPISEFVLTLTLDNGKEFSYHKKVAKQIGCNTYFAKPYHSWERGQNENSNGLLRQYFPKSMELLDVSTKQVLNAVQKLNSRPRKCLGYKTPYEVFEKYTGIKQKELDVMHL